MASFFDIILAKANRLTALGVKVSSEAFATSVTRMRMRLTNDSDPALI